MPVLLVLQSVMGGLWRFFTRPPGSYIALVGLFAAAMWWFGQHEFDRGAASNQRVHTVYVTREVARQQDQARQAIADSDKETGRHVGEDAKNKGNVRYIYIHDKALPDASAVCVNPDDADRLRSIR